MNRALARVAVGVGILTGLVAVAVIAAYAASAVTVVGALTAALIGGAG